MMFQVKISQRDPGVFNVAVSGTLDTSTYEKFEKELNPVLKGAVKVIILDLAGVDYVSSLGIGAVAKLTSSLKAKGGTVILTQLQPKIQKVFDIVKTMPGAVFKSIEEADAYLDSLQKRPS